LFVEDGDITGKAGNLAKFIEVVDVTNCVREQRSGRD